MHSIFVAVSSTYTFVSTPRTWSDASADCLAHGGKLATVPNAAAQSALMSSIDLSAIGGETAEERGSGGFWVGASDRQSEGHWTWHGAHRESLTYENWATRARAWLRTRHNSRTRGRKPACTRQSPAAPRAATSRLRPAQASPATCCSPPRTRWRAAPNAPSALGST